MSGTSFIGPLRVWLKGALSGWRPRRSTPWRLPRSKKTPSRECERCGAPPERPLTLLAERPEEVTDWVPRVSDLGRRMAWRLWPGPVTLLFENDGSRGLYDQLPAEVKPLVSPEGHVALRSPSHPIVREVLRLIPAPLVISMVTSPLQPVPATAECLAACRASTW